MVVRGSYVGHDPDHKSKPGEYETVLCERVRVRFKNDCFTSRDFRAGTIKYVQTLVAPCLRKLYTRAYKMTGRIQAVDTSVAPTNTTPTVC